MRHVFSSVCVHRCSRVVWTCVWGVVAGVFNVATKLNDMIARRKRQDAEKALEAAKAAADDDSGDDGQ